MSDDDPPRSPLRRGRLTDGAPPEVGESFTELQAAGGATIELIVSGPSVEPTAYDQDHDEWVAVLAGSATLEAEGEAVELTAGDWLVLPAHARHRVLCVDPGTRWLAVHLPPG